MQPAMNPLFRSSSALSALSLVVVLCCGCSGRARVETILEKADQAYHAGKYDEAEIEYKNVLQKDRANAVAIARLGLLYYEQGREPRAIPFLLRAKELQPENVDARLRLGLVYLAGGALKEARAEAVFVLERRPADLEAPLLLAESTSANDDERADTRDRLLKLPLSAPVLVGLGTLDARENRSKEAEATFIRAQELEPNSPVAALAIGMLRWRQNDLPAADAALKLASEHSPDRSPRRLKYIQFKIQTGDLPTAKQLLEGMIRKTPDFIPAWTWLAEIALTEKNYDESAALLAKALAREAVHPDAMLLNARLLQAKGEPGKAVAELEKLQAMFPNLPQVSYQLGVAYAINGDSAKAVSTLAQTIAAAPTLSHAVLALAEINVRRRDYASAVSALKPLVQEHPDIPRAQVLLAEAYRGQGNIAEAVAIYQRLEKQFPADPQTPLWRGMVLLQQNKLDEARNAFERAHELAPKSLPPMEQLLDLDIRSNQFAAARKRIDEEIAANPKSAEPLLLLAKLQLAQKDMRAAETTLQSACELEPDTAAPLFMLAGMYIFEHQDEKALEALQKLIAQQPKHVAAQMLVGMINDRLKNYPAARDAYAKVLEVDPKNPIALNNLAYLHAERLNELDKGLELAQRARTIVPGDPSTADTLGWILARKKQYARAVDLLKESAGKLATHPDVQYHLGVAHYMLGDEEPARAAFNRSLALNAEFAGAADARQRLAVLQINSTDTKPETCVSLEKRLTENPGDPIALMRLAAIYQNQGEIEKALTTYRAAAEANPKNAKPLISIARLYAAKQELPKAFESAKAARALAPDDVGIAHTVARLGFMSGDHRWAASLLDEVARKQPDNAEVLFDLGEAVYSIGRVADAEDAMRRALDAGKAFSRSSEARLFLDLVSLSISPAPAATASAKIEQALKADPSNVPALMAMAVNGPQKTDPGATAQIYEKVLARFPEFSPAQRELTLLYAAESGRNPKAAAIATKARQAFPKDAAVARAGGIIAFRDSEFAKAVSLLQESVASKPDDGEALYYLGMAQGKLNKRSESKQTLQRALDAGLKETLAAEAKKTLASAD